MTEQENSVRFCIFVVFLWQTPGLHNQKLFLLHKFYKGELYHVILRPHLQLRLPFLILGLQS